MTEQQEYRERKEHVRESTALDRSMRRERTLRSRPVLHGLGSVALSALETNEYFQVVKAVDDASHLDVMTFARALDDFGLRDMAMMADQAHHRMRILDQLTTLLGNDKTLEAELHRALEHNLWVLGSAYALIASNATLRNTLERWR